MAANYKSVDSLIAEIESSNFFKDNPHLIDKASIYRWVHLALKNFGLNIMQKKSKVVEIENFQGTLDFDFGKLALAAHCDRGNCVVHGTKDKLLDSYFYSDKMKTNYIVESSVKEDSACATDTCKDSETRIIEKFYLHDTGCDVSLHYKNPCYVKLGRDVLNEICTKDCVNQYVKDSPYSIQIRNQTIYANFKEGVLYIEYYALPTDENGLPIIPHSDRGKLEQFIEAHIKVKILADAQLSKDAQNIQGIFGYYVDEERTLKKEAKDDLSPMSIKQIYEVINANKQRMNNYNIYLVNNGLSDITKTY